MNPFLRALRGEFYLLLHRRSVFWLHVGVMASAALFVAFARLKLGVMHGAGGPGPGETGAWNFWPQFGSGTRAGLFLAEIGIVAHLAAGLPREIASGAIRDPMARRLSRLSFLGARLVVAVLLPLTLLAVSVLASAGTSALLFDGGDIMEDGQVILAIEDDEVAHYLLLSMIHGIGPLVALGVLAVALGAAFRRGAVALGAGLVLVLLPTLLHEALGDRAPWLFTDVLPALGADSFLERTVRFAAGFNDAFTYDWEDKVVGPGWWSPWPAAALAVLIGLFLFRRKAL
jgi:hypothetical protein